MKTYLSFLFCLVILASQACNNAGDNQTGKSGDSAKRSQLPSDSKEKAGEDANATGEPGTKPETNDPAPKGGEHPISLHWIGWDKPGKAMLVPEDSGWYQISGSQLNENREYLNIEGKIRRVSPKELEFIGVIETRTGTTNGGKPCIKEGKQVFYGKGNRTYYRLQNMQNCEGGSLVDYVDIFPGNSSL